MTVQLSHRGAIAAAVLALCTAAHAAPLYHVTVLKVDRPFGLNGAGDVAGVGAKPAGGENQPVLLVGDTQVPLADFGFGGWAWGLNGSRTAVGSRYDSDYFTQHPTTWAPDGSATPIGDGIGAAQDINDAGVIVGCQGPAGVPQHAFRWKAGVLTDLGTLGGDLSCAYAVNDKGAIAGYSSLVPGQPDISHAALWKKDGSVIDLGTLGGPNSLGQAMNSKGHVVGWSGILNDRGAYGGNRAFAWGNGRMINLGHLAGNSFAMGINADDVVVGYDQQGGHPTVGWVWIAGAMTALSTLVDEPGWKIGTTWAINDAGQITAQATHGGSNELSVLLTPVASR